MARRNAALAKALTGISGFDEITLGGLPRGRPTLVCGGAGCGKTLFGLEFLVRGARDYNEPGVCISFEETPDDLAKNVASLGFDLPALERAKLLAVDHIELDRSQIAETGEYDLEGLFIRIGSAIDSVKAKRVLVDTPEALFAGLSDEGVLRSELRRLFGWLKAKGVTAVITGERGEGTLTRHGLEEYVSDCVILLDHRVHEGVVTRRVRVLKYRGSAHGGNEYPFLIDEHGISVLPVTSVGLAHPAYEERISTGIPALDQMMGGKGLYRASSVLLSGSAGSGKTSVAAHFLNAACERGEASLFFSFEESPQQLVRNMRSIGIDLDRWIKKGLLHIHSSRPSSFGLEMHLVQMHQLLRKMKPRAVVMDPLSSLINSGTEREVQTMVLRLVDHLKHVGATSLFTSLSSNAELESTEINISSLVDTWLLLRNLETNGERNRVLYLLKSRGMAHSNQVREFMMTNKGIVLREVYLGPAGVLTGSARTAQELRERDQRHQEQLEMARKQTDLKRSLHSLEAQILALQQEKAANERELQAVASEEETRRRLIAENRDTMARLRFAAPRKQNGRPEKE
jgi:circadian clock protein KaiC